LLNPTILKSYETVIGLEVHVQLATRSKAFCGDDAAFGAAPNTHISAISLAHPGTLPRSNRRQVEYAVRLGLALGSRINEYSFFDRKNYFYADLPKGYQITQDTQPICIGGQLPFSTSAGAAMAQIHHVHIEEDAGKSIHDLDPHATLIDLNRAGVPLLEIVTEPDFRSGEEVDAFMTAMRQLVRYLSISDGNMEQGSMRCDVNVSVRKRGASEFGTRCEVKNVNSMRFARRAIDYEAQRQIALLESGGVVVQSTLNFDPETGITTPLRTKENANDYRYFPDPDLPPVRVSAAWQAQILADLPALPWDVKRDFIQQYQLSESDATLLTADKTTADDFQIFMQPIEKQYFKVVSNFFIQKLLPILDKPLTRAKAAILTDPRWYEMLRLTQTNEVSISAAYQKLVPALLTDDSDTPLSVWLNKLSLRQNNDADLVEQLVQAIMDEYPEKVAEYRKGKKGLLGFFVGEVMKRAKGKAEPKAANALVLKYLEA
jgi:aspartyl-tRNA(Asn)/glutamyl-tRNA(Gln) amidotransferase subunit B